MNKYLKACTKRFKNFSNRFIDAYNILFATKKGRLDKYINQAPHPQHALDLFKDEWSSRLPAPWDHLQAGQTPLFEDARISWAIQQIGGIQGKTVVELGPLEGGHSYMLQNYGAASITSIEANPRAYLRCLIAKQILELNHVNFLFGDFIEYLRHCRTSFDLCVASGVLYHMRNPVELIALAAQSASQLFVWTHYYDPAICKKNLLLRPRFSTHSHTNYQGFKHALHHYKYSSARTWSQFCGGPAVFSNWMSRQDILACCRYFGLTDIQIGFEEPEHPHGPCFAFVATKTGA